MPAINRNLEDLSRRAMISLGGVRPIQQSTIDVAGTSQGTHTVDDSGCQRVLVFHDASTNTDIRFALNGTADGDSLPVVPGAYFVVQAVKGDVLHFYNTTGGSITLNVVELY